MKVQEILLLMLYGSLKENLNAFRVNNVVEGSIYNQKLADQIPKLGWKSVNSPETSFRSGLEQWASGADIRPVLRYHCIVGNGVVFFCWRGPET